MGQQLHYLNYIGHSNNMLGLPTAMLTNAEFNDFPVPVKISGVREMNHNLFEMLGQAESGQEAAEAFYSYMMAMFAIEPEQWEKKPQNTPPGPATRYRSSYLRLLRGWGHDSNGPEGAVLKGWVESRFGIPPLYHKEAIQDYNDAPWMDYTEQKMNSRFHNNAIHTQLDILYEFCQWQFEAFAPPEQTHITLYRGTNLPDGSLMTTPHQTGQGAATKAKILRLNNLVSFSSDRDVASCFGDLIVTARIPRCKILFYNAMLPVHPLRGEHEYLVIGGDYHVEAGIL